MTRLRAAAVAVAASALLAACAESVTPEPSFVPPSTLSTATTGPPASPTESGPTPSPATALPEPGLPYQGSEILDAMRSSSRPGGVPDALETPAIAQAVAELLWTIDGTAWDTIAASGVCTAPTACRLELAGSRSGSLGEDVWIFEVEPPADRVRVAETTLGAVPSSLADDLDALARTATALDELRLTSVRWTPPPHNGRFELSYRDAGEEGSCAVELVLDATERRVIEEQRSHC